jgi:xanthine dehydrogenase accessory factor
LWPVPALVVVGDGLIADALLDAAHLLGWSARVTAEADVAVSAAAGLHRSDAFVVLSHDRVVDGPALAAALSGGAGYVGALGSRRTQAARREWLTAHAVPAEDQDRIHGPAGLDLDAHTPAEIAVSIVAEILAGRSASSGGALRNREGPVHVAGVQAPPPRY